MNTVTLILVIATALTGVMWLFDILFLKKKRKLDLIEREKISKIPLTHKEKQEILESGGIWGNLVSCFPVLFIVFLVRSFAYEPFRIPSASMMPTLVRGDFILVEKFRYGIRNPFTNSKLIDVSAPERGDIVVFKYPDNPKIDYIKRIVGLPGDRIIVDKGNLYIQTKGSDTPIFISAEELPQDQQLYESYNKLYPSEHGTMAKEDLLGVKHEIMRDLGIVPGEAFFSGKGSKVFGNSYGEWIVPEGKYFAMGDNREHSRDSRFWGFVPDDYLLGKAVGIWFSFTLDGGFKIGRLGGID